MVHRVCTAVWMSPPRTPPPGTPRSPARRHPAALSLPAGRPIGMDTTPPPPVPTTNPAGCPCATIGPALTAPGTSGRTWTCRECGTVWAPTDETPAGALIGAVLGGPASVGLSLTCAEADDLAAGLALLGRSGDALVLLRERARQDTDLEDEHRGLDDDALAAALDRAAQAARTTGARR